MIKRLAVLGATAAAIVIGLGGYALGATKAHTDTICATSKNVPAKVYASSHACPKGDHAVRWTITPQAPEPTPTVVEGLDNGSSSATAQCPNGDYAVGGGYQGSASGLAGISEPSNNDTAWYVAGSRGINAYAVCMP
jgi:hypothetical protein